MGYDMREGTVVRWYKKEGDTVTKGEVIADIETDKATVEFQAYAGGIMRRIVAAEGVLIPVGQTLAVIADADEVLPDDLSSPATAPEPEPAAAPVNTPAASIAAPASPPSGGAGEVRASPLARRLARERNIDLSQISGSGPGGRIVEQDVLNFQPPDSDVTGVTGVTSNAADATGWVKASPLARRLAREKGIDLASITGSGPEGRVIEHDVLGYSAAPASASAATEAAPGETERVDLSRMRQTIARVTVDSKREAPHFYLTAEIDMGKAMSLRQDINEALPAESRVSVNDLILKACALTLGQHPKFNAFYREDHLQMNASVNIGVAIALEAGLIVPGISDCQDKSLVELATASKDLIARANSGTLRNEEYSGTTFSVSNLGMFDIDSFAAIIYPPHAAVLAVGTVKEQPVVREGALAVAQVLKATLSTDHRVADGTEAAQFLVEVKRLLENPVALIL
jgi:pyruvate dehydrogenase E2 component (dihydrolipoamide acetyltransferase)